MLGADQSALTELLVIFSLCIGIGGLLNNKLLRGRVEATYVPLAILGMTAFSIDLYFASAGWPGHLPLRVAVDIGLTAVCGGLFVVPLAAMVQDCTPPDYRARVQAGNAVADSIFIVVSAALAGGLIAAGVEIRIAVPDFRGAQCLCCAVCLQTAAGLPVQKHPAGPVQGAVQGGSARHREFRQGRATRRHRRQPCFSA